MFFSVVCAETEYIICIYAEFYHAQTTSADARFNCEKGQRVSTKCCNKQLASARMENSKAKPIDKSQTAAFLFLKVVRRKEQQQKRVLTTQEVYKTSRARLAHPTTRATATRKKFSWRHVESFCAGFRGPEAF